MGILTARKCRIGWIGVATSAALILAGCSTSTAPAAPESGIRSAPAKASQSAESTQSKPANATTPAPTASPAKATIETHKFANDTFQIRMPSTWKLEKLKATAQQINKATTASFSIVSDDGRKIAEIRTDGEEVFDLIPFRYQAKNTLFDSEKDATDGVKNYAFISYQGQPNQAEMMVTALDPEYAKTWGNRIDGIVYQGGTGEFFATLDKNTDLPGIPDSLVGAERFKAYTKTDEYAHLKKAMLSFEQIKTVNAPSNQTHDNGSCLGAQYAYKLNDSGLSCEEAKSFLTKMLNQPVHTGAVEIVGVGVCLLAYPGSPGYCNIERTGGTFNFSER